MPVSNPQPWAVAAAHGGFKYARLRIVSQAHAFQFWEKEKVIMNAKLIFTLMLAMFVGRAAFSQSTPNETHEYLEIKDDPEFVADKLLSLELCGPLTFSKGAGLTLGIGLNGLWALTPKVQAQGTLDFLPIQIVCKRARFLKLI